MAIIQSPCFKSCLIVNILFLLISNISFIKNVRSEECDSMDLRNDVSNLVKLENCTVIKGYLQIVLMERIRNESEFQKYQFKKLREITGFLLIYRVNNLKTLAKLFPNLAVIRGQQLFANYALILFGLKHMEDIGLKSLVSIQRGNVRIDQCPSLCTSTVNWTYITPNGLNFIEQSPTLQCPSTKVCRGCEPKICWSSMNCQKTDESTKVKNLPHVTYNCHAQCLGGCTGRNATNCSTCRNFRNGTTCVDTCPEKTYLNPETYRCIDENECVKDLDKKIFNEEMCLDKCPHGYIENSDLTKTSKKVLHCTKCIFECPKICEPGEINSLIDAEKFRGCTIVNGTLNIRINEDRIDIMTELEKLLGDIEEIYGYLKVYRSYSITSLDFLRSLTVIWGKTELEFNKYAMVIYENNNLQTLWSSDSRIVNLTIMKGGLYFHYNSKLCLSEISSFQSKTNYTKLDDFVSIDSNGYKHTCNIFALKSEFKVLNYENVTICWREFEPNENQTLLGYLIYLIEAPHRDLTTYYGRDACSKFSWKNEYISLEMSLRVQELICYNITFLKQFTQYAFYVRTYITQDETYGKNGQSEIKYFQTQADMPSPPTLVSTIRKSSHSVTLMWATDHAESNLIDFFKIDIFEQPDDAEYLSQRDYCKYPIEEPKIEVIDAKNSYIRKTNCCCILDDYEDDPNSFCHDFIDSCRKRMNDQKELIRPVRETKVENSKLAFHHKIPKETKFNKNINILLNDKAHENYVRNKRADYAKSKYFLRTEKIDRTESSATISDLKPFTAYAFQFFVCSSAGICSPYFAHFARTDISSTADDMNMTRDNYSIDKVNKNQINIRFTAPVSPNGATVTFIVEYRSFDFNLNNSIGGVFCINRYEHERNGNLFELKNLTYGLFGVHVRSVSIAQYGKYTEWAFFHMNGQMGEKHEDNGVIITLTILFFATIGIAGYYLWWRYKRNASLNDVVALISNAENPNIDEDFNIILYANASSN